MHQTLTDLKELIEPTVVHFDEPEFKHEPCCEWVNLNTRDPICDQPAEWVLRSRCCGLACIGCDPHIAELREEFRAAECMNCWSRYPTAGDMFTYTRL